MSALGFEVHVDKENATPAPFAHKGGALKSFGVQKDKGKLSQPTPRKALFDVNHGPTPAAASRGTVSKELGAVSGLSKDGLIKPLKSSAISDGAENVSLGPPLKKQESKMAPPLQKQTIKVSKDAGPNTARPKSAKVKKRPPPIPDPGPEIDDENYDSDTIFPRAERLSSYVDKLLAWRPPCLFGTIPDSESDNSEPEDPPQDDIIMDMPPCLTAVPEFSDADLATLLEDLPLPVPDEDQAPQDSSYHGNIELSLDQTIDTSLSLGSLHVMHGSLDVSGTNSLDSLELSALQE